MKIYLHKYSEKKYFLKSFLYVPVMIRFYKYGITVSFNRTKFKNMISFIFWVCIVPLVGFFYLAKTKVTFKPFTVTYGALPFAIGMLLLCIGCTLIRIHDYKQGYKEGKEKTFKAVTDAIDQLEKEKKFN